MAKKEQNEAPKEKKAPFYKKASFPWAIIIIVAVYFSGIVTGWHMHIDQSAQVDARANEIASQLKTSQ